jgi:hypothetical protein
MLLVAVGNHEHTEAALRLKQSFAAHAPALAIDSGSRLSAAQARGFDQVLPNVYYGGLLNAAVRAAQDARANHLLFLCSDVSVAAPEALVNAARQALSRPDIGVYAPHCETSGHRQMRKRAEAGLHRAFFVEGFCFAARLELLTAMCPVNLELNGLGWGLDIMLGYEAFKRGMACAVDDALGVQHARGTGYDVARARRMRRRYVATRPLAARFFHRAASFSLAKTRLGYGMLSRLLSPLQERHVF